MDHHDYLLRERFQWVDRTRLELLHLIGDDVLNPHVTIQQTVDPLKFLLKIRFVHPLAPGSRQAFRTYWRVRAEQNGCDIPLFHLFDRYACAELLLKSRHYHQEDPR